MKIANRILIVIMLILVIITGVFIAVFCSAKNKRTETTSTNVRKETFKKVEMEDIDIDNIIAENTNEEITQEITTEEIDLEYTTIYRNNGNLAKGQMQVLQEGRDGKQTVVTRKTYKNGEIISEEQTGRTVTVAAIDKIIEIGSGVNVSSHKVQKGDKMYVTSYTLNMMSDKKIDSEKITTLNKNDEVKLLEISGEWYKVSYKTYSGWVKKDCLIYREEKITIADDDYSGMRNTKTKEQINSSLSENMKLTAPSGLTLEQFKEIFKNDPNDKNKVFVQNAEYFYYIEKQYNINGIFVAAVGIHESAWGTSKISLDKKNLFGYGASDSNPYGNAYSYSNYSESIDMIARVFVKYYLNPKGTKIYDNEVATGAYYSGPTIADVNKRYATDKNWHNGVYHWMEYLYGKID